MSSFWASRKASRRLSPGLLKPFTTDEYNSVLFSWYFKGFELLRRYLVKHPSGVDMGKLDLEEVDQEMAANEANHSAIETDALKSVPANEAPEGAPADNARAEENVVGDA